MYQFLYIYIYIIIIFENVRHIVNILVILGDNICIAYYYLYIVGRTIQFFGMKKIMSEYLGSFSHQNQKQQLFYFTFWEVSYVPHFLYIILYYKIIVNLLIFR